MSISNRVKLRHLAAFVEVARRKSVTAAAEALHVTQPALSRALRELQDVAGAPLTERDGRGIRLTAFGAAMLPHATQALAQAEQALAAVQALDAPTAPPLRIGALPTVAGTLIPAAVARLRADGMHARLSIVTGENRVLLDQLGADRLDLVVGRLPAPESMLGLAFDPLFRERVVAVVAEGHPLLTDHRPEAYAHFPVLIPRPVSIIRPFVDRLLLEQGIALPTDVIETVSTSFGRALVRGQRAIWFISQGVVADEIAEGRFATLPLDTRSTLGPVGLCTAQATEPSPVQRRFVAILHDLSRDGLVSS
ncbi:pca operon transcription factor PcaQ [Poseidonocella sedimentorum]|nr:pca operon transcription factor PcaQ [Poseidonocella sedimentorum]